MKKVKTKIEVQYNGHSIKKNGAVDLNFKSPYSELVNSIALLQLLNCNVQVKAKVGNNNPIDLGTFYLDKLSVDRDGESSIKFNTEIDNTEINMLNELTERETIIHLLCSGVIEDEDEEE